MKNHEGIQLQHIHKTYASNQVHACDDISLSLELGLKHIIVGENGAGKSTIMKILSGDIRPDSGKIFYRGAPVSLTHPEDALNLGIGMIHQVLHFFPELTVREHLILGMKDLKPLKKIDSESIDAHIAQICKTYNISFSPDEKVEHLDAVSRQLTALLALISRNVEVFILDEPPQEVLMIAQRLNEEGKTIIVITHNINDAISFGDEVTVLRGGTLQGSYETSTITREFLANRIMGDHDSQMLLSGGKKRLSHQSDSRDLIGNPLVILEHVSGGDLDSQDQVEDISLEVGQGETLAVVGIRDNGLKALESLVAGYKQSTYRQTSGRIRILGKRARESSYDEVGYIPSERLSTGGAVSMSVIENLIMPWRRDRALFRSSRIPIYSSKRLNKVAKDVIRDFSIKGSTQDSLLSLSGGNIQKLITARALHHEPQVLICADISWGLDIKTREALFNAIEVLKSRGMAVLFFTSEVNTAIDEADRIAILRRGRLVSIIKNTEKVTAQSIGEMML